MAEFAAPAFDQGDRDGIGRKMAIRSDRVLLSLLRQIFDQLPDEAERLLQFQTAHLRAGEHISGRDRAESGSGDPVEARRMGGADVTPDSACAGGNTDQSDLLCRLL